LAPLPWRLQVFCNGAWYSDTFFKTEGYSVTFFKTEAEALTARRLLVVEKVRYLKSAPTVVMTSVSHTSSALTGTVVSYSIRGFLGTHRMSYVIDKGQLVKGYAFAK
jgi:hypothetical protein